MDGHYSAGITAKGEKNCSIFEATLKTIEKMKKVALIIIYNHQFNKNIDIVENIYRSRFSHIYHLMPFYEGDKPNVISVYENSFYFQGYIAQGLSNFYSINYQHYIFIADDMVLNPIINEDNYTEHFKLNSNSDFIPRLDSIHLKWKKYNVKAEAAAKFKINLAGLEVKNKLPEYDEALNKLHKHNIAIGNLKLKQIVSKPKNPLKSILYKLLVLFYRKTFKPAYPLTSSYSDIFVISSESVKKFAHYCGVFAATKLFVEVAIPTALALASDDIVLEENLTLQGRALWNASDYSILEKYNTNLQLLLKDFPKEYLYLHPIKLTEWNK